jgi:hypothetical protein
MKKIIITVLLSLGLASAVPLSSRAQSVADVIQQLVLDYQKLASLKNILNQMYTGYTVLSKGYGAVKGAAQGNFSLHEAFLDELYLVSPTVRKYPRVTDIINEQAQLVSEYKSASTAFHRDHNFNPDELAYMMTIYNNLVSQSLKNLEDLVMVVTDSQLRMNDAERLTAIDRIYLESHNQLSYLRKFNEQATKISRQRTQGTADRQSVKSIYGLTQ